MHEWYYLTASWSKHNRAGVPRRNCYRYCPLTSHSGSVGLETLPPTPPEQVVLSNLALLFSSLPLRILAESERPYRCCRVMSSSFSRCRSSSAYLRLRHTCCLALS